MKKTYLLLVLLSINLFSQVPTIDPTFNAADTGEFQQNIGIKATMLPNGKMLSQILGNGGDCERIIRINTNGSVDRTFNEILVKPSITDPEYDSYNYFQKVIPRPNGDFILLYTKRIRFFNENGVENFNFIYSNFLAVFGSGISSIIDGIYQDDGKVFLTGVFNLANNTDTRIIRFNGNGTLDTTFNAGSGSGGTGNIGFVGNVKYAVKLNNGKYIVNCSGTYNNTTALKGIARFNNDGTLDNSFSLYTNANNGFTDARKIIIQPDGKILVACQYFRLNLNTIASRFVARLLPDGLIDSSFNHNGAADVDWSFGCKDFILQNDGKIIYNQYAAIKRMNIDGSQDLSFNTIKGITGIQPYVAGTNTIDFAFGEDRFISIDNSNKIYINGDYITSTYITRTGFFRLNSNASGLDLMFNPHFGVNTYNTSENETATSSSLYYSFFTKIPTLDNLEHNKIVLSNKKILLLGNFTTYNDQPVKQFIRLTEDGIVDPTFNLDSSIRFDQTFGGYLEIKEQNDGKLLLISISTAIMIRVNTEYKNIIRINSDGSFDPTFNFTYSNLNTIAIAKFQQNGKIILLGNGPQFGLNNNYKYLMRLNLDGSKDTTLANNFILFDVEDFDVTPDNKIVKLINNGYGYLKKYSENGVLESTISHIVDNVVYSIKKFKFQEDGKLIIAQTNLVKRLNQDGTLDPTFLTTTFQNEIISIILLEQNKILIKTNNYNGKQFFIINQNGVIENSFGENGGYDYYGIFVNYEFDISQQSPNSFIVSVNGSLDYSPYCNNFDSTYKNNMVRYNVIELTPIPLAPTGEVNQDFTAGQTLINLNITGQNIQWYSNQNVGAPTNSNSKKILTTNSSLPSDTLLVDGKTYFASQTINGYESSFRLPITVHQVSLNTKDFDFYNLNYYPNPIENLLSISNQSKIEKVEVFDFLGQNIFSKKIDDTKIEINFSNYNSGIYFMKIFSENNYKTIKLIKK